MDVYASDPQGFGREICSAAAQTVPAAGGGAAAAGGGLPDLSSDLAQYRMVEGFQDRGDGLMPGKQARWTLAEDASAI